MPRLAIDVVLLPDDAMTKLAVNLSVQQSEKFNDVIVLDPKNCLPHISLAMGVIDDHDIPAVGNLLDDVATEFQPLTLVADQYRGPVIPSGEVVSELTIVRTPELQTIHQRVLTSIQGYASYDVSLKTLYTPPTPNELTLYWIRNYVQHLSGKPFEPHITIGFGMLDDIHWMPTSFTASTLALCHLGNYCTCRRVLHSVTLQKK